MKKEFLSRPITKKFYENYDAAFGKTKGGLIVPLKPPLVKVKKIVGKKHGWQPVISL